MSVERGVLHCLANGWRAVGGLGRLWGYGRRARGVIVAVVSSAMLGLSGWRSAGFGVTAAGAGLLYGRIAIEAP